MHYFSALVVSEGEVLNSTLNKFLIMAPLATRQRMLITISKSSALTRFISYSLFSLMRQTILSHHRAVVGEHLHCYEDRSKLHHPRGGGRPGGVVVI